MLTDVLSFDKWSARQACEGLRQNAVRWAILYLPSGYLRKLSGDWASTVVKQASPESNIKDSCQERCPLFYS